ncbi:MAG: phosphatidylserine decarboxylase [Bdellovibrio sp.]|nr:phosphatidylserine decarboxylase [Bdellovibrio sp.]
MSAITRFLPKNHLSYFAGKLVHLKFPPFLSWLKNLIIENFAQAYKIDLNEVEFPIEKYDSLGEFFIRRLKPGLRPLGQTWALNPADAVITQAAVMTDGKLIQAKGKTYSLQNFTQDPEATKKWMDGIFLTYYLCPTDYHRVHSPVTGYIKKITHIPGALWPVNAWSTENIHELFSINERILVEIETDRGPVGVMFVGATNVGQIILTFDTSIVGNQLLSSLKFEKIYDLPVQKGDELGAFRMGSTVVMLYAKGQLPEGFDPGTQLSKAVKVNSPLA